MITIPIYYLVVGGVILLWLIFKLFEYKSKLVKPEQVYVDSSGIASNPPKFIDVLQNKTINFVVNGEKIVISQLSIGKGLTTVNKIAMLFDRLGKEVVKIPKSKVDQFNLNMLKTGIYKQIVYEIYILSKPFVKSRRRFKKALVKMSNENHEKVLLIVEQIFDYWMYIKKLIALLAKGGSLRQTIGEGCTWNSYAMDTDGNRIIKPRYDLSMN